jgi:hypothetical protein
VDYQADIPDWVRRLFFSYGYIVWALIFLAVGVVILLLWARFVINTTEAILGLI